MILVVNDGGGAGPQPPYIYVELDIIVNVLEVTESVTSHSKPRMPLRKAVADKVFRLEGQDGSCVKSRKDENVVEGSRTRGHVQSIAGNRRFRRGSNAITARTKTP